MGMLNSEQSMLRENQTRGCVLEAEETVDGPKETLGCLKTQTAQGKLHTELKNGVLDKALLCTSRGGGILKAWLLPHRSNGVEQEASSDIRSSVPSAGSSHCSSYLS